MALTRNDAEVVAQLEAYGLELRDGLIVGKFARTWHRDLDPRGQQSGWYKLHELHMREGGAVLVGAYGSWRDIGANGRPVSHKIDLKGMGLSADEREAMRVRLAEDRKAADARRAALADRAARRARKVWGAAATDGQCAYLARKGVRAHGVRFTARGNLLVPMCDAAGRIHGLQVIYGDAAEKARRGRDKDYWPAGMDKRGCFHLIGPPADMLIVCEGYATGASLHEATGISVAVAFDAGSLRPVAEALRKRYRQARILIAFDDDRIQRCRACREPTDVSEPACQHCGEPHGQHNPGRTAAEAAALAVEGAVVGPVFTERAGKATTDFNDLARVEGPHVARAQVEAAIERAGWRGASGGAGRRHNGEAGSAWRWEADDLERDYSLIYTTETVFDHKRRLVMGLSALRAAAKKARVREWLESERRRTVMPDQVVFDPGRDPDEPGICNLWGGWPTEPRRGNCEGLLELFEYLASNDEHPRELFEWLLKWLAYPIQHPGAKMATALLVHGPEGTGKNLAFGAVKQLYGRYGAIFSQTELESQYNDWASGKLFAIGNEVVSRAEMYHQQGRLKNMITEPRWQVSAKFLPVREEDNHCNFVFFSNNIQIAKLDRNDRRYCVVWTPEALSKEFYDQVVAELDEGGAAAFHAHLASLDLGDFNAHTKPPLTRAKRELCELGLDSTERFWRDWTEAALDVPVVPCRSEQLYRLYQAWAARNGISKAAPLHVLVGHILKVPGAHHRRCKHYSGVGRVTRQSMVVFPPGRSEPPAGEPQIAWLSKCIEEFGGALVEYKDDNG